MTTTTLPSLQPGDCLLYAGKGFWSWLIKLKTFSPVSHCECYIGDGSAVASRDGQGVARYAVRLEHLAYVLRPTEPLDLGAALVWFEQSARGQSYDWWGLARLFRIGKESTDKQFCSEFLTRFYRAGGFHAFGPTYDADLTTPGMFRSSPHMVEVWRRA